MSKHKYSKAFIERTGLDLENINPGKAAEEVVETPKAIEQAFTDRTLGMYRIPQVGDVGAVYVLVEIPFNPATGAVGQVKELLRDIREDAIEKFKMEASNYFRSDS